VGIYLHWDLGTLVLLYTPIDYAGILLPTMLLF
jgi:hypothetical protein